MAILCNTCTLELHGIANFLKDRFSRLISFQSPPANNKWKNSRLVDHLVPTNPFQAKNRALKVDIFFFALAWRNYNFNVTIFHHIERTAILVLPQQQQLKHDRSPDMFRYSGNIWKTQIIHKEKDTSGFCKTQFCIYIEIVVFERSLYPYFFHQH